MAALCLVCQSMEDVLFSISIIPTSVNSLSCVPTCFIPRDQSEVLAEDREKLRVLQPHQPWFSQEQREELAVVHPWIQRHTIPQEIDTQVPQGP